MTYLYELREKAKEIRTYSGDVEKMQKSMLTAAKTLLECIQVARNAGLLALEDFADDLQADFTNRDALKEMIMLVVDGVFPEQVEEISLQKYFINNLQAYEGLEYLMLLVGVRAIQEGEKPNLIHKKIRQLLPDEVIVMLDAETEVIEFEEHYASMEETIINEVKDYQYRWDLKDEGYFHAKLVDYVFEHLEDRDIQRITREINDFDLAMSMRGMSLIARNNIFTNVSQRFGAVLAGYMTQMCAVRLDQLKQVNIKILEQVISLHQSGIVTGIEYGILETFLNMLEPKTECLPDEISKMKYEQLRKLLKDYESVHFARV